MTELCTLAKKLTSISNLKALSQRGSNITQGMYIFLPFRIKKIFYLTRNHLGRKLTKRLTRAKKPSLKKEQTLQKIILGLSALLRQ
jgi:hypothetical protein